MTQTPRRSGIRLPWSHEEDAEADPMAPANAAEAMPPDASVSDAVAPSADAPAAGASQPASVDAAPMSKEDNALLASLVAAMREVAERERAASIAGLRTAVDEAIQRLEARAADGAEHLRQRADLDVAGIADWIKAETERIEEEGRAKTETRRAQLARQLTEHEERARAEIEAMRGRVDAYEQQLAGFFTQLHEIDDPAAFGTAAKRMPRPPSLGLPEVPPTSSPGQPASPEFSASTASANGVVASEDANAAGSNVVETTAETMAETTAETTAESTTEDAAGSEVAMAAAPPEGAAAASTEAEVAQGEGGPDEANANQGAPAEEAPEETLRDRMDALGIPEEPADFAAEPATVAAAHAAAGSHPAGLAARLAELDARLSEPSPEQPTATVAMPATGGELATAIMVSGLGSFGAITSFKQALERVDGVHGISLSLGPTGEFVYRATHDAGFDLVAAIEQIERGTAKVDRQADGSLRVAVQRGR